jgi:hypothetical protein
MFNAADSAVLSRLKRGGQLEIVGDDGADLNRFSVVRVRKNTMVARAARVVTP